MPSRRLADNVIDLLLFSLGVLLAVSLANQRLDLGLAETFPGFEPLLTNEAIATHGPQVLLIIVLLLVGKALAFHVLSRRDLANVRSLARPEYQMLDPEDPRVHRLIRDRLEEKASQMAPDIPDLVHEILETASFLRASDVHLDARPKSVQVNYRIDGVLSGIATLERAVHHPVINRLKIMANLDISKSDTPQDGRITEMLHNKKTTMRLSTFPTLHGEKAVIRIMDSRRQDFGIQDFGLQPEVLRMFRSLIHQPQGVVLFTGPTGSGKTTLMYASLAEILESEHSRRNIVTLEDPIEQELADVSQSQIDTKKGITFAVGLRALLRQDPDVILVGEIRDLETAQIALQAGQTGHLLFSTVHANSAAGAFGRLIDMGLEPYLLSSVITGIVAQRLVRRLCRSCKRPEQPAEHLLKQVGLDGPGVLSFFAAPGCSECDRTGFKGRVGVFELLKMSDAVAHSVVEKRTARDIENTARGEGMVTLLEDGLVKVHRGETSLAELIRVVAS